MSFNSRRCGCVFKKTPNSMHCLALFRVCSRDCRWRLPPAQLAPDTSDRSVCLCRPLQAAVCRSGADRLVCVSVCLSVCLRRLLCVGLVLIGWSVCLCVCLSVCLSAQAAVCRPGADRNLQTSGGTSWMSGRLQTGPLRRRFCTLQVNASYNVKRRL